MGAKHLFNLASDKLATLPLLVLYLTDGCNSRCVTCDIWRNPRRNMARSLIEQIAAEVQPLQIRWVVLSGGEAMQHPHWDTAARLLRAAGARVILLTNGLLLRRQVEQVLASVDEVVVSLDAGTAPTYEAIRGVDAFDLVLDGIRAVRAGGVPVTTRTTLQQANFREMPQLIEAAHAADVNSISFLTVDVSNPFAFGARFEPDTTLLPITEHHPPTNALTAADILEFEQILDEVEVRHAALFASGQIAESPAKLRRMAHYFRAVGGALPFEPPRCNAPHTSVVVEVDGTLRPCYFLPTMGRFQAGTMPLASAINSDVAQALRRAYRQGERDECARCVCPLYKGPRALWHL